MEKRKVKCFISYCYNGMDQMLLDFITLKLKSSGLGKFSEILYDKSFVKPGFSFDDFIKFIDEVNIIIILFTPQYKLKVENHENGVWKEYQIIMNRFDKKEENKKNVNEIFTEYKGFHLIPIILQGDATRSIPAELKCRNLKYIDFTNLRVLKSKKKSRTVLELSEAQLKVFNNAYKEIKTIFNSIYTEINADLDSFKVAYEKFHLDWLFKQTKADFTRNDLQQFKLEKTLFVKIMPYKKVETQASYFVVGRKGSGKSALIQVLPIRCRKMYTFTISILANHINLTTIYNSIPQWHKSDSLFLNKRIQVFSYSWRLFIRILIMENYLQLRKNERLTEIHKNLTDDLIHKLLEIYNCKELDSYYQTYSDLTKRSHIFLYAFNAVIKYFDLCIKNARPEEVYFFSDIEREFNYKQLLRFTLGEKVNGAINKLVASTPTRILITFDDIDSYFSSFRQETKFYDSTAMQEKIAFETGWLYSLLSLVCNYKELSVDDPSISRKLDFCLAVPDTRFFEILRFERDAYRLQEHYNILIWTGLELGLMLRKRLEVASNFKVESGNLSVKATLDKVLKDKFKFIPRTVTFEIGNRRYELDIFEYILRYTFWRPRDVLKYFANVIAQLSQMEDLHRSIDSDSIRACVRKATVDIIKTEFLNEYKYYIDNISDIINKFEFASQVISFHDIKRRLEGIDFHFVTESMNNQQDIITKIKHLYQLGFLGVYAKKSQMELHNLQNESIFIFNEGASVINNLKEINAIEYEYIIHPIFQGFLSLKLVQDRLICHYTWEYLERLEGIMFATNQQYMVEFS